MKNRIAAVLLIAALATLAGRAEAYTCQSGSVTGYGRPHITMTIAQASAIRAWRAWADIKYGWRYKSWTKATDKHMDCANVPHHLTLKCVATARPCR